MAQINKYRARINWEPPTYYEISEKSRKKLPADPGSRLIFSGDLKHWTGNGKGKSKF
jgi:hypothetical protein